MATDRPVRGEQDDETPAPPKPSNTQCAFMNFDRQCPFSASYYPRGGEGKGFCTWHAQVIRDPRINTLDEFIRFCAKLKGPDDLEVLDHLAEQESKPVHERRPMQPRYCSTFTHFAPGMLWDHLEGKVHELPMPRACYSPSCPHAPVELSGQQIENLQRRIKLAGGIEQLDLHHTL